MAKCKDKSSATRATKVARKLLDGAKKLELSQMHLKLIQKEQFKKERAETTGDLIGNKMTDVLAKAYNNHKITKIAPRSTL